MAFVGEDYLLDADAISPATIVKEPANSTASDRNRGCTRIYPGLAPRRVKTYILLV
jgi:hypothetical protein